MPDASWVPAYIGLGSNLGEPVTQIDSALAALASLPATRLITQSRLYCSPPLGGEAQPDYINAVGAILTRLEPLTLLEALHVIERRQGRDRTVSRRWAPRTLDLDLLVYGELKLSSERLEIPHPGIPLRNFVLLPLLEVAPGLHIAGLGRLATLAAAAGSAGLELVR